MIRARSHFGPDNGRVPEIPASDPDKPRPPHIARYFDLFETVLDPFHYRDAQANLRALPALLELDTLAETHDDLVVPVAHLLGRYLERGALRRRLEDLEEAGAEGLDWTDGPGSTPRALEMALQLLGRRSDTRRRKELAVAATLRDWAGRHSLPLDIPEAPLEPAENSPRHLRLWHARLVDYLDHSVPERTYLDCFHRNELYDGRPLDFEILDHSQGNRSLRRLTGCSLRGCNFNGAVLTETDFSGTDFSGALLQQTVFDDCRMHHVDLSSIRGEAISFRETELSGACLSEARMDKADLDGAILTRADLSGAQLRGALFNCASIKTARFDTAELTKAAFVSCDLGGASFTNARLDFAMLEGCGRITGLEGASLRMTTFHAVDLSGCNPELIDLSTTFGDGTVRLPPGVIRPQSWVAQELAPVQHQRARMAWQKAQGIE